MANQTLKIVLIIALTVVLTVAVIVLLMPVLGPRLMHPLTAGNMPMHGNNASPANLDYSPKP